MFNQIIVCTDGSDQALQAARVAGEIAQKFRATLTLLSVFDLSALTASYESLIDASPYTDIMMQASEATHENVQKITGEVLREMGVPYQSRRETGHPVDTIVRVAKELDADLIVMGSRGMGGFKSFLLGSVSDGVLHHAHCPVLIVR